MLPKSIQILIALFFSNIDIAAGRQEILQVTPRPKFHLRHAHALTNTSRVVFQDVPEHASTSSLHIADNIRTRIVHTHRPLYSSERRTSVATSFKGWELEPIPAPDITDPQTVLELARMTNNAYARKGDEDWYEPNGNWTHLPFGWEPDDDGFRGHVFVAEDNSTVILTIKGTSPEWFLSDGGPTARKDKLNDNLLFSCCCARVSFTWKWSTVCDCFQGGSKCSEDCVEDALVENNLFYNVGINLYNNLTYLYPDSKIWIIGHSLGGALASLLGVTFGAPVVAFEAPGEKLASRRLHLPIPPSTQHITHFYHTGDPIAMGTCNGALSSCSVAGYALETRCHLGQSAVWDTITELGWSSDIRNHAIQTVVDRLLALDGEWYHRKSLDDGDKRGLPQPKPEEDDCLSSECFAWEFV